MFATGTLAPRPPGGVRPRAGGTRNVGPRRTAAGQQMPVGTAAATAVRTDAASVDVDTDGRITAVSRTAQRLLGWRAVDLVGRSLLTLTGVSSGRALSHGSMLLRAVRQGQRLGIGDVELVCKDHSRLPVTCTVAPRLTDGVVRGAAFAFAVLPAATAAAGGTSVAQAQLAVLGEPVDVTGAGKPVRPLAAGGGAHRPSADGLPVEAILPATQCRGP